MKNQIEDLQNIHSNISENFSYFSGKVFLYLGIALGSFSVLQVKEQLQFFCLIGGSISVTLSIILYILKIYQLKINIKILSRQLKDEIKHELNKKC